jgi:RNA polymerase sigma-70 factor (ECF subfamily)
MNARDIHRTPADGGEPGNPGNPGEPGDLTILRQIADGDLTWFDVFARRHGGRLVAWLDSHLHDHHTAEELAQDVLLKVFKAARDGQFDDRREDLTAWLFTIANHRLIDHLRKVGRSSIARAGDMLDALASNEPDPAQTAVRVEQKHRVHAVIEQLPVAQRQVVRLKVFAGLTFAQIARLLDCPEPTIKSRMRYALLKVRQMIHEDESA